MKRLVAAATLAASAAGCSVAPQWPVSAEFAGTTVVTQVDSPAAVSLLEGREPGDPSLDELAKAWGDRLPSAQELAQVSRRWSPDVAALLLWRQVERRAAGDGLVADYRRALEHADALPQPLQGELFLLVPGWLYRSDTSSGADLEAQARLLRAQGARVVRADTDENGTVAANAQRVVDAVRHAAAGSERITLVSASKGGAEVALALSWLARAGESDAVHAWVNIGGTLRGTPLADLALSWPACWFVQAAVLNDGSFDALRSVATAASAERAAALQRPAPVRVVNLIGIPLSGQVSPRATLGYRLLRGHGPNDGITALADALAPDASTIALPGVDHFFQRPDLDRHTLAVAWAITRPVNLHQGLR